MSEKYANAFATQLASSMFAGDLTAQVAAAAPAALQGGQFRIAIDAELMLVTAGASTTAWTVTRGVEGTGAAGHTSGSVVTHILTAASLLGASGVFDVRAFGAKGDGSADDTAAIQAAITAASVDGGVVTLPPGTFNITSPLTIADRRVSMRGSGVGATTLHSTSTTDTILYTQTAFSVWPSGVLSDFGIDGHAGASAVGIHIREVIGLTLERVRVGWFSTGVGILIHNDTTWTERTTMQDVWSHNNLVGVKFSVTGSGPESFAFTRIFDLRLNLNGGDTGILLTGISWLYCSVVTGMCNMQDAGIVFEAKDTSKVTDCDFSFTAEQTSGTGGIGFRAAAGTTINSVGQFCGLQWGPQMTNDGVSTAQVRTIKNGSQPSVDVEGLIRQTLRVAAVGISGTTTTHDFPGLTDAKHGWAGFLALSVTWVESEDRWLHAFYTAANTHGTVVAGWHPGSFTVVNTENTFANADWAVTAALSWVNGDLRVSLTWGSSITGNFKVDVALFGTAAYSV
jgi:hypothetical protein